MKRPILKLIILPIIIFLLAYIIILIISSEFISLESVRNYNTEGCTLHNIRVMKYYFITLPFMSLIPTIIYYSFYIIYKKIYKLLGKEEKNIR